VGFFNMNNMSAPPEGPRDFRFRSRQDLFGLAEHVPAEKRFGRNLDALRLLAKLEAANRAATPAEQLTLARYVGWGDSEVLNRGFDKHTGQPVAVLREILPEADLGSMRASALNAHYTDLEIAGAMWDTLARVIGASVNARYKILDPSSGTGHFYSTMPPAFAKARLHACEIETWTARIFARLHPSAKLYVGGFESAPYAANSFDLIVSNVPFGAYGVFDERMPDRALKASIHTYFFAKAAQLLRPGGVIAFITSRHTLDAKSGHARRALARDLELVAHVRLPSNAFERCAGTTVVADILILQKSRDRQEGEGQASGHAAACPWASNVDGIHNPIYDAHPERVLGRVDANPARHHADQYRVHSADPSIAALAKRIRASFAVQLPAALQQGPEVGAATHDNPVGDDDARAPASSSTGQGSSGSAGEGPSSGAGQRAVEAFGAWFDDGAAASSRANSRQRAMLAVLYGAAKTLIKRQIEHAGADEILRARHTLNEAYDAYVVRFGRLNGPATAKVLKGHPFGPFMLALETHNPSVGWDKAALFSVNTVRGLDEDAKPASPEEALVLSMNRFGAPRAEWMVKQLGITLDELRRTLAGRIFRIPGSREFAFADVYLSGNLRDKLIEAEGVLEDEPDLAANIAALREVMPAALTHEDITARLGAAWIPERDVMAFLNDTLPGGDWRARYLASSGTWTIHADKWQLREGSAANERFGTKRVNVVDIVDTAINSKPAVVWDELPDGRRVQNHAETELAGEKVRELLEVFDRWVWTDPARRERLVKLYNERFNVWRAPRWNGAHLALPGLSESFRPHGYQKDGVWQQVVSKASLLAFDVGAGKTATAIMGMAECLRLGLAGKAMVVVPNHLVSEWQREINRLYPQLSVIAPEARDFAAANRKRMLARIATDGADVIVLAHSQYKLLPVSRETEAAFIRREIELTQAQIAEGQFGAHEDRATLKEIERTLKQLEVKLKELTSFDKDETGNITFEELGVDMVVVDEAHLFKNLFFVTRMGRIKGVTNASSQRAWDAFMKTRWLLERGKRVVYLTATPIANSMCEAHVFMRSLQAETLDRLDLLAFDAWARQFGEAVPGLELDPSGGSWRMVTRFAKFVNLPELGALWRQVLTVKPAKDLDLDQPGVFGGAMQPLVLPMSVWLRRIVEVLVRRADRVRAKAVQPHEDNMLKITGEGRKAALDVRLFAPALPVLNYSKVRAAARFAFAVWHASEPLKATQMIFCDLAVPRGRDKPIEESGDELIGEQASGDEVSKCGRDDPGAGSGDMGQETGAQAGSDMGTQASEIACADDPDTGTTNHSLTNRRTHYDSTSDPGDAAQRPQVYGEFARELMRMGVPAGEIAFVHQAKNRREKQQLFDKMNSGEIRFLLGSTERMGAGTNAQKRLINMIHLDPTWTPAGLIQRTGRIVRQGNIYPEVGVWCMQHEGSFDVFMYQGLLRKISFIAQALSGDLGLREMEDVGDQQLTFEDLTAAATGNPKVQRKAWLERELARLHRLRRAHEDASMRAKIALQQLPAQLRAHRETVRQLNEAADWITQHVSGAQEKFSVTLCSRLTFAGPENEITFDDRASAGAQVIRLAEFARTQAIRAGRAEVEVGRYKGLTLLLSAANFMSGVEVHTRLKHVALPMLDVLGRIETPSGVFASLDATLRNFYARPEDAQAQLDSLLAREAELKAFADVIWDKGAELAEASTELAELEAQFKKEAADAEVKGHAAACPDATCPDDAASKAIALEGIALPAESYLPATPQVEKSWSAALAFIERVIELHRDPEPLLERLAQTGGAGREGRHERMPFA
jgi:N12 class adenine-specific DNA methylase